MLVSLIVSFLSTFSYADGPVTSVVTSYGHSCAVIRGGVQCWGFNNHGQLGNGTDENAAGAKQVIGMDSGATQVSVGKMHSCAVVRGGVQCWGINTFGRLGTGDMEQSLVPRWVKSLEEGAGVESVSVGNTTSCAVLNGGLKCWGWNWSCQLGQKDCEGGPPNKYDVAIEPKWVSNLGPGSGVTKVSMGGYHSCAIVNGGVKCWGNSIFGRLGDNRIRQTHQDVPTDVYGMGPGSGIKDIAAGSRSTCAVDRSGGVKCWGWSKLLGMPRKEEEHARAPLQVPGLSGMTAVSMYEYTICTHNNKDVYCWGSNVNGQFGNGAINQRVISPEKIKSLPAHQRVQDVSTGFGHSCFVLDGDLVCMGWNAFCQVGDGVCDQEKIDITYPVRVVGYE